MMELSELQKSLLDTPGYILVLGGPGSGKTTVALLKADKEIQAGTLLSGQRILFLSFARATIARVAQQAGKIISDLERSALEINTYHGFAWNLIRSHGYLLNNASAIRLLPPPEAASRLAELPTESRPAEIRRLFSEEGLLHFDLFASVCAELLNRSDSLTRIFCDAYPIIILDEFQDTNSDEWELIKRLGSRSRLIALADAEQRIYEFRGADPRRIGEFSTAFSPTSFDFGIENHRSNGTDIVEFGNDLLTGVNKAKVYSDVVIFRYPYYQGFSEYYSLKTTLFQSIQRQSQTREGGWSIAVLVTSKNLMLAVSDYLSATSDRLRPINHDVALDTEGPSLAAELIAGLLEGGSSKTDIALRMISDICTHIRGRRGNTQIPQLELDLTGALGAYISTGKIRGTNRHQIVDESIRIADARLELQLTGDPFEDWRAIRALLQDSSADQIRKVADDAKYLRLLHKGSLFQARLDELWRLNGSYVGAASAIHDALLQEHFSASTRIWHGVHVMTIHKAKGKEFDEVIIFEGRHRGRIVRNDASERDIAQARLSLRVAVTRAIKRTTILTPANDVCNFLQ